MEWLSALCLSAGIAFCSGSAETRQEYYRQFLEQDATTLQVQTLDGTPTTLNAIVPDPQKPILLNLWATWCPPCLQEMPDLNLLAQTGLFNVVVVSVDMALSPVQRFVRQNPTLFSHLTVAFDQKGDQQEALLGGKQYPTTYLLDPEGHVQRIYIGPRDWAAPSVQRQLQEALKAAEKSPNNV